MCQINFVDKDGTLFSYVIPQEYIIYTNPYNKQFKFWHMSHNSTTDETILLLQRFPIDILLETTIFRENVTPVTDADTESYKCLLKFYYSQLNRCRLEQMVKE